MKLKVAKCLFVKPISTLTDHANIGDFSQVRVNRWKNRALKRKLPFSGMDEEQEAIFTSCSAAKHRQSWWSSGNEAVQFAQLGAVRCLCFFSLMTWRTVPCFFLISSQPFVPRKVRGGLSDYGLEAQFLHAPAALCDHGRYGHALDTCEASKGELQVVSILSSLWLKKNARSKNICI